MAARQLHHRRRIGRVRQTHLLLLRAALGCAGAWLLLLLRVRVMLLVVCLLLRLLVVVCLVCCRLGCWPAAAAGACFSKTRMRPALDV